MTFANRRVMHAVATSGSDHAVLAVVLETEGSTYVRAGAMALFDGGSEPIGWLSGGCLEPEIARNAAAAATHGELRWMQIDTRDDEDLLAGSAIGCRGQLRLALLPLRLLSRWHAAFARWLAHDDTLALRIGSDGSIALSLGAESFRDTVLSSAPAWDPTPSHWSIRYAPLPRVAVFGAGPETPFLLPALHALSWRSVLVERRERWLGLAALADCALAESPQAALQRPMLRDAGAALVMHHHFERDREALEALAPCTIGLIGLLGPPRRRDDLFKLLPAATRDALQPRLRSPVGLDLGGHGAEAIVLSIVAQLQRYRHGE